MSEVKVEIIEEKDWTDEDRAAVEKMKAESPMLARLLAELEEEEKRIWNSEEEK